MIDAYNLAATRPWAIQAQALETILTVADRLGDPQALQGKTGRALENTRRVVVRDDIAVIPVTGPIFRYANLFTEVSGATSTGMLAKDISAAIESPSIRGLVLEINSPGGEVAGINELAKLIRAGAKRKRIVAYGESAVASGAYWLASAASEIVVDETAHLGSIGVVMSYLDTRKRDEAADVRKVEIVSSQSPDKLLDPGSDEGRAKAQALVDELAGVFIAAVADYRGTTVEKVMADFGRGGVLIGASAVKAGMADRIGSLESVIAELAGSASAPGIRRISMTGSKTMQVTVSTTEDLRQALAAGHTADQIEIAAASQEQLDAARREGEEAGRKSSHAEAIQAERTRILEIQALTRPGFEAEASEAIATGAAPEAFAHSLLKAAQDRGITLEAIRKDAPPPAPHSKGGDAIESAASSWDSVVTKFGGK